MTHQKFLLFYPTIMLPKTFVEKLTKMKAHPAKLNQKLKEVQEETDHKEKEHMEEAAC